VLAHLPSAELHATYGARGEYRLAARAGPTGDDDLAVAVGAVHVDAIPSRAAATITRNGTTCMAVKKWRSRNTVRYPGTLYRSLHWGVAPLRTRYPLSRHWARVSSSPTLASRCCGI
jgi:hypothetical protein